MVTLKPNQGLIVVIRRNDTAPPKFMVSVRATECSIDPDTHDIILDRFQKTISEPGEFDNLEKAVKVAAEKIETIVRG
jgi:hypothetical protein